MVKETLISQDQGNILFIDSDNKRLAQTEKLLKAKHFNVHGAPSLQDGNALIDQLSFALIFCHQDLANEFLPSAKKKQPQSLKYLICPKESLAKSLDIFNHGLADRVLSFPIDPPQLEQICREGLEAYKLSREKKILEKLIFLQRETLEEKNALLQKELQLGALIQEKLLKTTLPTLFSGIDIAQTSQASKEVDGDFIEYFQPSPLYLDVCFADVMGKGVASALVGQGVRAELALWADPKGRNIQMEKGGMWKPLILTPSEIIKNVHAQVSCKLLNLNYFVTLFFGRFDWQKKLFSFIDCGAAKPLYYSQKTKKVTFLSGDNLPLGVLEKEDFSEQTLSFDMGDLFVFYSDGITESKNLRGELFGTERLAEIIEKNFIESADALIKIIEKELLSFTKRKSIDDDRTLLILKIGAFAPPVSKQKETTRHPATLDQLSNLRKMIHNFAAPYADKNFTARIELAVNEAFCNLVEHSLKDEKGSSITITWEMTPSGISVELCDEGEAFDPSVVQTPNFVGEEDGGFGWYLIKELCDVVQYVGKTRMQKTNSLRLLFFKPLGDSSMEINHFIDQNILIIAPKVKELDAHKSPQFKTEVLSLIEANHLENVVFDLTSLNFIDSSGLGTFLSILRLLNARGGDLKLSAMNGQIRVLFELVRMHKIFEIYNTPQDAVTAFKK